MSAMSRVPCVSKWFANRRSPERQRRAQQPAGQPVADAPGSDGSFGNHVLAAGAFTVRPADVILARETRTAIVNQTSLPATLRGRLDAVEQRLHAACRRAGRDRRDVTLVAVTKLVPVAVAAVLPELGLVDLGENRPQELW